MAKPFALEASLRRQKEELAALLAKVEALGRHAEVADHNLLGASQHLGVRLQEKEQDAGRRALSNGPEAEAAYLKLLRDQHHARLAHEMQSEAIRRHGWRRDARRA